MSLSVIFLLLRLPPISSLFPYTTLFRSVSVYGFSSKIAVTSFSSSIVISIGFSLPLRSPSHCEKVHPGSGLAVSSITRSEEHTSELQSRGHLVCRLLLEKKKKS